MLSGVNTNITITLPSMNRHSASNRLSLPMFVQPERAPVREGVSLSLREHVMFSIELELPCGRRMLASVIKPGDFSAEGNPFLIVEGTDFNGESFTKRININTVDPRNASLVEMLALDGYLISRGMMPATGAFLTNLRGTEEDTSSIRARSTRFDALSTLQQNLERNELMLKLNLHASSEDSKRDPLRSIIGGLLAHTERRSIT